MLHAMKNKKPVACSMPLLAAGALAFSLTIGLGGCSGGNDSYDKPAAADYSSTSSTRLLSVDTLQGWIDAGKVNSGGFDNVVILNINSSTTTYDAGHIPGAQFLNRADIYQTRVEGPMSMSSMVPTGAQMDTLLQSYGITEDTTIVLTGSSTMYPARMYFTLRYWGFPKEKIVILDGLTAGYEAAGYTLTDVVPTVAASTFSVRYNDGLNDDLRASLGEMIAVAEAEAEVGAAADELQNGNPATIILDNRSVTIDAATTYAYNGRWNGAVQFSTSNGGGIVGTSGTSWGDESSDATIVAEELRTYFESLGATSDMTIYVHCTSGTAAANAFFALDGILGWDVVLYDGSWGQMRVLAPEEKGGALPDGSMWVPEVGNETARMSMFMWGYDIADLADDGTLNDSTTWTAPEVNLIDAATLGTFSSPTDPRANQIENEDAIYMLGGDSDAGSDGLASGGGGGC